MIVTTPARAVAIATVFPVRRSSACEPGGISHDDVIGHRLDNVVQRLVFPIGDGAALGIGGHAKRLRLEDARHLQIGGAPLARRIVVWLQIWLQVRLHVRRGWQTFVRGIAHECAASDHGVAPPDRLRIPTNRPYSYGSARVLCAAKARRIS
ncbi:hypothetical protein ACVWWP_000679 [Bradyrhizobium sp. LM3.6]